MHILCFESALLFRLQPHVVGNEVFSSVEAALSSVFKWLIRFSFCCYITCSSISFCFVHIAPRLRPLFSELLEIRNINNFDYIENIILIGFWRQWLLLLNAKVRLQVPILLGVRCMSCNKDNRGNEKKGMSLRIRAKMEEGVGEEKKLIFLFFIYERFSDTARSSFLASFVVCFTIVLVCRVWIRVRISSVFALFHFLRRSLSGEVSGYAL